jgi:hypothetical protein
MRVVRPMFRFVLGSFLICSLAAPVAAVSDALADTVCGEGATGVILCGAREALCVPDNAGCGIAAVSCCPPCQGEGCPDQSGLECSGVRASCVGCDVCFTASLDRAMAPVLGPVPLAGLMLGLLAVGVGLVRRRLAG